MFIVINYKHHKLLVKCMCLNKVVSSDLPDPRSGSGHFWLGFGSGRILADIWPESYPISL